MVFADVIFSTEAIGVVSMLVVGLASAVGYIFRLLIQSKDAQIAKSEADTKLKEEEAQKKILKEIAEEAIEMAEFHAERKRMREGLPRIERIAHVVPEHDSPPTKEQYDLAELQTLRARVTAATLALDLPPRNGSLAEIAPPTASQPPSVTSIVVEDLKADVEKLKQGQIRADIAAVKEDVAGVPDKTVEKLNESQESPGGQS